MSSIIVVLLVLNFALLLGWRLEHAASVRTEHRFADLAVRHGEAASALAELRHAAGSPTSLERPTGFATRGIRSELASLLRREQEA